MGRFRCLGLAYLRWAMRNLALIRPERCRSLAGPFIYGFARMNIDGHFPRWGVAGAEAERTAEGILDLFIEGIAKVPAKST